MDTNAYWKERGKTYRTETRLAGEFYRRQETLFFDTVRSLNPSSILEVGCGFGRMTRVIAENSPGVKYVAVDLSTDQLAAAEQYCEGLPVDFACHDLLYKVPLPQAEVCVASEVLLHVPHKYFRVVITKIFHAAEVLVHDFDPNWTKKQKTAKHCFYHEYDGLYRRFGLTTKKIISGVHGIYVVRKRQ